MNFNDLSNQEQCNTIAAMRRLGGGFVSALGDAWNRADSLNSDRLAVAFPDIVSKYGPGSDPYSRIEQTA